MSKIIVEYNSEFGYACSDGNVSKYVDAFLLNGGGRILVGTSTIVDEFRIRVVRGEISHEDIIFKFEDEEIEINQYGRLSDWPEGFCDFQSNQISAILASAYRKRIGNTSVT